MFKLRLLSALIAALIIASVLSGCSAQSVQKAPEAQTADAVSENKPGKTIIQPQRFDYKYYLKESAF